MKVDVSFVGTGMDKDGFQKFMKGIRGGSIVLVGKSNVGKSSMINCVFERKNLARTSKMPGKTQGLNFYAVEDKYLVVDTPGYGYAKVSKSIKNQWQKLMENYFEYAKEYIGGIIVLIDIRRGPTAEDFVAIDFVRQFSENILVLLTKSDKVGKMCKLHVKEEIAEVLSLKNASDCFCFSVFGSEGRSSVEGFILRNWKLR